MPPTIPTTLPALRLAVATSLALLLAVALAPPATAADDPAAPDLPNFVFIQAEACGWTSLSVPMDEGLPDACAPAGLTPHLSRLAAEGMRFSAFYAAAPRCTPTRASWLTGISPAALHMTYVNATGAERRGGRRDRADAADAARELATDDASEDLSTAPDTPTTDRSSTDPAATTSTATTPNTPLLPPQPVTELPADTLTVAELLRDAGYATAHFGKWHVGRASPSAHGFEQTDGPNTNSGPGDDPAPNPEQATAITARGIAFIEEAVAAGRPFYLQLSHYGGGSEDEVTPQTLERVRALLPGVDGKSLYRAGVLADVDGAIGTLLAALDDLALADDTWVIFSTDHG